MSSPRIVLDSNVIISGFLFGGAPARVLEIILAGQASAFTSPALLNELRGVLLRPKFGLSAEQVFGFVEDYRALCELVVPAQSLSVIDADPEDNRILECAVEAGAEVVVSGDAHLQALLVWNRIRILAPAAFLSELPPARRRDSAR